MCSIGILYSSARTYNNKMQRLAMYWEIVPYTGDNAAAITATLQLTLWRCQIYNENLAYHLDLVGRMLTNDQDDIAQIVDWFWHNCTVSAPAKSDMHYQD